MGAGSICTLSCVTVHMARLGASRSPYEPRCGRGCLLAQYLKFGVVSRVTCAYDSGSMGKHMCIHLNQAYSNPPAKRFLLGGMYAACRRGYVVCWTISDNPRKMNLSSNASSTCRIELTDKPRWKLFDLIHFNRSALNF